MPFTPPENVGILSMGIYFPNQFVEQSELEAFDGVSAGKYTIGLGQIRMAFCDDREDIYSITLTALSQFLHVNRIPTSSIGRLEVGTETILDKAKSIKSVLMQLFGDNTDILGVDTMNACYGGTNALFNAVNWIESRSWDGRLAIVVAGDIALYAKGNARPTGGAGAVVMLIGPNAPIVLEPGLIGSHMEHVYDFYKPDLTSEYPIVDGHFSITCYTRALDKCYQSYNAKYAKVHSIQNGLQNGHHTSDEEPKIGLDRFDHIAFHSPTCKLVQKSYARLLYNDFLSNPSANEFTSLPESITSMGYETSLTDKGVEKTFMTLTQKKFNQKVFPGTLAARMVGNMYTASVYSSLASIISKTDEPLLPGQRIGVFSYGSGLAASFFSFKVTGDVSPMAEALNLHEILEQRVKIEPQVYDELLKLREQVHLSKGKGYLPQGSIERLRKGTYYLTKIDEKFRRVYSIKE